MSRSTLFGPEGLAGLERIELAHELRPGIPQAGHAGFEYELLHGHDQGVGVPGSSPEFTIAVDRVAMGLHAATHMDSLTHVAVHGCLHGGGTAVVDEDGMVGGLDRPSLRTIVAEGVLLDFPALFGVERLDADHEITPDELLACAAHEGIRFSPGQAVLIRTGWDTLWETDRYLDMPTPGPGPDAARFLHAVGAVAAGSDTMAFEHAPGADALEVHAELLVHGGIHILENLELRELSRRRAYAFGFMAVPLRFTAGTGSPVTPLAFLG